MTNEGSENGFDLQERTAIFAERTLLFCKKLPVNVITKPIISQLVRSATSVGANYCEADNAASRNDFKYKIAICRKESRETCYWLRMIITIVPEKRDEARPLSSEARELNLIFSSIFRKFSETVIRH
ncbi:four helix bundle protein [Patescibacteria group bacterium]|nr:four helix bundle protein [Patescibacteria group bacterium]MBU1034968.1 four helix bundle protein [Patescibacteria group bacterium]MBU1629723.1 four helix bundle protein [Patescibacteria group bacterium]MBU1907626.1 four helix bundle protein [Patescibacteria group bacterium]